MNGSVLVAYGSRNGSTADIAAAIAEVLRSRGLDVTLRPAHQVHSVHEFEFVILGSAIYAGRWRRDALALLSRERRPLMARHVWLFQSGLSVIGAKPDPSPTPAKVRALAREIGTYQPVTFPGCLLPETARGLLPRLMARTSPARGDHRDWERIHRWASAIADDIASRTGRVRHETSAP